MQLQRILVKRIHLFFNLKFTRNLVDQVNHLENYTVGPSENVFHPNVLQRFSFFLAAAAFLPTHICLPFFHLFTKNSI